MSNELSTEVSPEILNSLILTGDMSKLTPTQQTQYYTAVCNSVGINPITQPFAIIILNGKKTLYATKGCTQQLSDTRSINTEVKERKTADSVYIVSVRATMKDGRFTDEDGIVSIVGLKGVELANAMMKAVTKAKRRAVLALCGLGMPDETEVEDIVQHPASVGDPSKSRIENIIDTQIEPEAKNATKEENKQKTKEEQPKKQKETVKKENIESDNKSTDGQHKNSKSGSPLSISGLIEETKIGNITNPITNKPGTKHSFKIGDKFYGTFDIALAKGIMDADDNKRLVRFTYTERDNPDKTKKFQDITGFSIVTADEVAEEVWDEKGVPI